MTQVLEALKPKPGKWLIDATFGQGGHSRELLAAGANVVGLDHDHQAIIKAQEAFASEIKAGRLILIRENFIHLRKALSSHQQAKELDFAGILYDFGTSTNQLMDPSRGFSFTGDGPLDMRMDDRLGVKAADLLGALSEKQLEVMFSEYGGEERARAIAKSIVRERKISPITTTSQLVDLIKKVKKQQGTLHPATKVFQALRIAVNLELDNIALSLPQALDLIKNGVIVTLAFHEGEDRLAKHFFVASTKQGRGELKALQTPSSEELKQNPRARSTKMRVFITRNKHD